MLLKIFIKIFIVILLIKRNNIIILAIFFKFNRIIVFVTVKNKKAFSTFRTRFGILIEIFNLF